MAFRTPVLYRRSCGLLQSTTVAHTPYPIPDDPRTTRLAIEVQRLLLQRSHGVRLGACAFAGIPAQHFDLLVDYAGH
jgi:hypothetical protein